MSAYNKKAVTYTSIFRESKLASSLEGNNKKQKLQNAWEEVYRNHERLPYTLTRKIVHAAIDYRFNQRNPLTREELDQLSCIVTDLGYDMEKELKAVKLKEDLPEIKIPPAQLIQRLESHPLVSEIVGEPLQLFKNGHFNEILYVKFVNVLKLKYKRLHPLLKLGKL
ncbi:MAG: hypothetical protein J7502_02995 [Flavisolibacter sp.]|nr:hypothetical protein [Flavisolibacter sp.]